MVQMSKSDPKTPRFAAPSAGIARSSRRDRDTRGAEGLRGSDETTQRCMAGQST